MKGWRILSSYVFFYEYNFFLYDEKDHLLAPNNLRRAIKVNLFCYFSIKPLDHILASWSFAYVNANALAK